MNIPVLLVSLHRHNSSSSAAEFTWQPSIYSINTSRKQQWILVKSLTMNYLAEEKINRQTSDKTSNIFWQEMLNILQIIEKSNKLSIW